MPATDRKYMTFREAADELGVHEHTIARYMDFEGLEYLWVGGKRKITRPLWEKWLKSRVASGPLEVEEEDD